MSDKEYIEKSTLLKELESFSHLMLAGSVVRNINAAENVEEVIYCKDCKYRFVNKDFDAKNNIFCLRNCDSGYKEYDYCSKGKKRE